MTCKIGFVPLSVGVDAGEIHDCSVLGVFCENVIRVERVTSGTDASFGFDNNDWN